MTSIIIPCYFADETFVWMTSTCIASLARYGKPDQVILVDDGSPYDVDPSDDVDVWVAYEDNRGYAGAVNAGLDQAEGDIIIISNNDIEFTPGWLEAILKPLDEGYDIASICTTDNGWDTEDKITEGDKFGSLWAMKRKVYDTIGGLDESFGKGYFEDLDYQRRAERAGFRVGKNHNHLVEHTAKATFSVVDPEDKSFYQAMDRYKAKYGRLD